MTGLTESSWAFSAQCNLQRDWFCLIFILVVLACKVKQCKVRQRVQMKFADDTVRRYQSKGHQAVNGEELHDLRGKSNRTGIKFYSSLYKWS